MFSNLSKLDLLGDGDDAVGDAGGERHVEDDVAAHGTERYLDTMSSSTALGRSPSPAPSPSSTALRRFAETGRLDGRDLGATGQLLHDERRQCLVPDVLADARERLVASRACTVAVLGDVASDAAVVGGGRWAGGEAGPAHIAVRLLLPRNRRPPVCDDRGMWGKWGMFWPVLARKIVFPDRDPLDTDPICLFRTRSGLPHIPRAACVRQRQGELGNRTVLAADGRNIPPFPHIPRMTRRWGSRRGMCGRFWAKPAGGKSFFRSGHVSRLPGARRSGYLDPVGVLGMSLLTAQRGQSLQRLTKNRSETSRSTHTHV